MIQRRQTIFLLIAILLMVAYIYTPVIKVDLGATAANYIYPTSMFFSKNVNFPIIGHYFVLMCVVATGISIGINIAAIGMYTYRKLQIAFCWLGIAPLLYVFCYVYYKWSSTETLQDQYFYFGNILPLVAIVFVFLAMFYIRKDEELVKSVDRLR